MFKKLWNNFIAEKNEKPRPQITGENISDENLQKINKAMSIVASKVKYPEALFFHSSYTLVNGLTVTLKYTCNGETITEDIKVTE